MGYARLRAKVAENGPLMPGMASPCHEWTGTADAAGYPKFWLNGNSVTAQRALQIIVGVELDPTVCVINICGNRQCVREDHLAVGSRRDAHALRFRGTSPVGPGDLAFMRSLFDSGQVTIDDLAEAYDLSTSVLDRIGA